MVTSGQACSVLECSRAHAQPCTGIHSTHQDADLPRAQQFQIYIHKYTITHPHTDTHTRSQHGNTQHTYILRAHIVHPHTHTCKNTQEYIHTHPHSSTWTHKHIPTQTHTNTCTHTQCFPCGILTGLLRRCHQQETQQGEGLSPCEAWPLRGASVSRAVILGRLRSCGPTCALTPLNSSAPCK